MKRTALSIAVTLLVVAAPSARSSARIGESDTRPFAATPYSAPSVRAAVKPYTVAANLANVANLRRMNSVFRLTPEQRQMLAKNGFVVTPSSEEQLFFVYENNDYLNIPSFVSTDAVLQVYHVFYDFTLRKVEQTRLVDELKALAAGLADASAHQLAAAPDDAVRGAARRNLAYAAVARKLIDPNAAVPAEVADTVAQELELIERHAGRSRSPIAPDSGVELDYSQFVPRGHYTRAPELERYFKAMMWLGLVPFPIENARTGAADRDSMMRALLLTSALYDASSGAPLIERWDRIYAPTAFYVGAADDITPVEIHELARPIYGPTLEPSALADATKFDRFAAEAAKTLRAPRIAGSIGDQISGAVQGREFRLMGQRFVLDSRIFQELTYPKVGETSERRLMPKGLDVMAALGSARAREILDADPVERAYENYASQSAKMRTEVAAIDDARWHSNLFYSWLWTLQALLEPAPAGYPSFMRNAAWADKNLSTALGSWAELKHDTVLYGKQSGAECGGDEPPMVRGYVEPNVELYARLRYLTEISHDGLVARGLVEKEGAVDTAFSSFDDLLTFLETVSQKELRNEALTDEEYYQIRYFGAQLERLTLSVIDENLSGWFEIESETDKDMALVTDVHTGGSRVLQVGVGHANNIFVIAPVQGRLQIMRGAVFSYYEFEHPASDRLTDEAWQAMIKRRTAPKPPAWTRSFTSTGAVVAAKPGDVKVYSSGC
jgi:hypothetical protein